MSITFLLQMMKHNTLNGRVAQATRIAVLTIAILVACPIAGCNPYHRPQNIDPATELAASSKSVRFGSATLQVPDGWAVETIERFDDEGQPLRVSFARWDKRGRVAYLLFEMLEERPIWQGNADISETSTTRHGQVFYDVIDAVEPSGDDTPGMYTLRAYVQAGKLYWFMDASFFTPVQPNLMCAVNYMDAIVMNVDTEPWKTSIGAWYGWKDDEGVYWQAIDLAVSNKKERVTFLCRRAEVDTTEHSRAIRFSEADNGHKVKPLPCSVGGRQRLDVFWYEPIGDDGPFLRLSDWQGEYLVNLRKKTTSMVVRVQGRTFADELPDDYDTSGYSVVGAEPNLRVYVVDGRLAKEVTGVLARDEGELIGKIDENVGRGQ